MTDAGQRALWVNRAGALRPEPARTPSCGAQAGGDEATQEESDPPQCPPRRRRGRVERMGHDLFGGDRVGDSPDHEREVKERVEVASHGASALVRRRSYRVFRGLGGPVEIGPPQRRRAGKRNDQAEHGFRFQAGLDRTQPGGHHRLAEGDDDEEGVALGEVSGADQKVAAAGGEPGPDLKEDGGQPQPGGGRVIDQGPANTKPMAMADTGAKVRMAR